MTNGRRPDVPSTATSAGAAEAGVDPDADREAVELAARISRRLSGDETTPRHPTPRPPTSA